VSPVQAIKSVFRQYAKFSGRARRSEFWWFTLFYAILSILAAVIDATVFGTGEATTTATSAAFQVNTGPAGWVLLIATFLPSLAVSVRRLHDINRRGWWVLLSLIPLVGAIILIVWACFDSKPTNEHGPNPKDQQAVTA